MRVAASLIEVPRTVDVSLRLRVEEDTPWASRARSSGVRLVLRLSRKALVTIGDG
jgi:hypothetical protein